MCRSVPVANLKPVPLNFWFMTVAALKRDGDTLNEVHDRYVVLCARGQGLFELDLSDSGTRFPSIAMFHRFCISCVRPTS